MDYNKDIFGTFAVEVKLSHKNEILAVARMKSANADEIFGFAALDEINPKAKDECVVDKKSFERTRESAK